MDLHQYWRTVRKCAEALPEGAEFVYLVSIENAATGTTGNVVSMAGREYAARWMAGGTHKLASQDEIDEYDANLRIRTSSIIKAEIEKKQTIRLETAIPDDQLQRAIAAAMADQTAASKKSQFQPTKEK